MNSKANESILFILLKYKLMDSMSVELKYYINFKIQNSTWKMIKTIKYTLLKKILKFGK